MWESPVNVVACQLPVDSRALAIAIDLVARWANGRNIVWTIGAGTLPGPIPTRVTRQASADTYPLVTLWAFGVLWHCSVSFLLLAEVIG